MWGKGLRWRAAVAALMIATVYMPSPVMAKSISIRSTPVPLSDGNPHERNVGALTFLGGLSLHSSARGFGGFSDLHVSADGTRLLAVSDMGYWLQAEIVYGKNGALQGLRNARLSPMLGLEGKPIVGKRNGDAEGLAVSEAGIYVSFEHRHRIWRYPLTDDLSGAIPAPQPLPADMIRLLPRNKGMEALARLPGGSLLILTEESLDREGNLRGWLRAPGSELYAPLRVKRTPPFDISGAALLPDNSGLLILERRYSAVGGLGVKLCRVPVSRIAPNALLTGKDVAEFRPGQNIDNFEGVSTRVDANGATEVYLISDDNFNIMQRTLLMQFKLEKRREQSRR